MNHPSISLTPIGTVYSSRKDRIDDRWNRESSYILIDAEQFTKEALVGLAEFSHIEVIFSMHQLAPSDVVTGTRHPRDRIDWPKVGIFAQRGGIRPNQLGLTCCRIQRIEELTIYIEGLDAVDGTPVLDIKPYFEEYGPQGTMKQPPWVSEMMRSYWK